MKTKGFLPRFVITVWIMIRELLARLGDLIRQFGQYVEGWLTGTSKAQYGLAVARMGLGATGLGLLLSNFHTRYYSWGSGVAWSGERVTPVSDFPQIWLFSLFYRVSMHDLALTAYYLFLMVLAVLFILGWRMRIVLPVFGILWVGFIESTDFNGDQGDNIYRMALIGLLFADTSLRWSLDSRRRARHQASYGEHSWLWGLWRGRKIFPAWARNMSQNLVLIALTAQISFIYVSGALYKAGGAPWFHGTAIYSPLHVAQFGTWPALSNLITAWAPAVAALTYGALMTQLFFPAMLLNRWTRKFGIFAISGVHVGIGVLMGLPWFSLAMIALDFMFIRDVTWRLAADWVKAGFRRGWDSTADRPGDHQGEGLSHPVESSRAAEPPAPIRAASRSTSAV